MPYPTDGFVSTPVSVTITATDNVSSDISVASNVQVTGDGSTFTMTQDQTQALFNAIGDAVISFINTTFPGHTINSSYVTYTASKIVTIS
jgi:hypothetical protein